MKKKVVVIGGGNGSAIVLCALKKFIDQLDLSAVISMSDSGGSSGKLRREFKTLPPGDIMRAALAMSPYDYHLLKQIFYRNRFDGLGRLDQHNLGNLFIILSEQYEGDFIRALRALEQAVEAVGKVYPVTLGVTDLAAELSSGMIIKTEAALDKPQYDRSLKIKKVWLEPERTVYAEAERAIKEADYIILSPGDLYTSVIATLLPNGVQIAIQESAAQLVYIAGNALHADGETGPERLSDIVKQLENHLPRSLDLIIYNNVRLNGQQKKLYQEKKWIVFEKDVENIKNRKVIGVDFEKLAGGLSPEKLAKTLQKLIV